jgi:hypothetical protein
MPNERYSKAALHAMYNQGKGILSPLRFSQKQVTYQWTGFGIGVLGAMGCLKLFDVSFDGWFLYLALAFSIFIGILGVAVMTSIFNANFVRDDSLDDPLFPSRR